MDLLNRVLVEEEKGSLDKDAMKSAVGVRVSTAPIRGQERVRVPARRSTPSGYGPSLSP